MFSQQKSVINILDRRSMDLRLSLRFRRGHMQGLGVLMFCRIRDRKTRSNLFLGHRGLQSGHFMSRHMQWLLCALENPFEVRTAENPSVSQYARGYESTCTCGCNVGCAPYRCGVRGSYDAERLLCKVLSRTTSKGQVCYVVEAKAHDSRKVADERRCDDILHARNLLLINLCTCLRYDCACL
jgi:hypothetical protein